MDPKSFQVQRAKQSWEGLDSRSHLWDHLQHLPVLHEKPRSLIKFARSTGQKSFLPLLYRMTREEAEALAEASNADLARFDSMEELRKVQQHLPPYKFWIDGRFDAQSNRFQDSRGKPMVGLPIRGSRVTANDHLSVGKGSFIDGVDPKERLSVLLMWEP